jgi:ribosomal protein L24E
MSVPDPERSRSLSNFSMFGRAEASRGSRRWHFRDEAQVGMEPIAVIRRKCEHCGEDILRYDGVAKAKLTKKTTRFCSAKCQKRAQCLVSNGCLRLSPKALKNPVKSGLAGRPAETVC